MIFTALIAATVAVALGLVTKYVLASLRLEERYGYNTHRIAWSEFLVVAIVMFGAVNPIVLGVGRSMSVNNIMTYTQELHGVETDAIDDVTDCRAGYASGYSASTGRSNCHWQYDSGRTYNYEESHTRTVCTGSGEDQTCRTETYYTTETASIYYPYATREHTYTLTASMGKAGAPSPKHFEDVYIDKNPIAFDKSTPIPGDIPRGAPADWLDAKKHLDAGNPRSAHMLGTYANPILATGDELLTRYSDKIDQYLEEGILPDPTEDWLSDPLKGENHWLVNKVSFVNVNVPNQDEWQYAARQFNAAFGMGLRGSLSVVLVGDSTIPETSADEYTNALATHWQDSRDEAEGGYGKRALPKNAVVVVLGVKGDQVAWARAATGMPFGNKGMAEGIALDMPGSTLTPRSIFGAPHTVIKPGVDAENFTDEDVTITLSSPRGALEEILFESSPFKRASMSCNDEDETCEGFADLVDKIDPTPGQKAGMVAVTAVLALILWMFVGFTSVVERLISAFTSRWKRAGTSDSDDDYRDPDGYGGRNFYQHRPPTHYREDRW